MFACIRLFLLFVLSGGWSLLYIRVVTYSLSIDLYELLTADLFLITFKENYPSHLQIYGIIIIKLIVSIISVMV